MLKKFILISISSLLLISCSRKANDYSQLVSSYKNVFCSTMSSTKSTPKDRIKEIKNLKAIKLEFREAMRYLKQEEKEKLNQMIAQVELEFAEGKCN
jgi:hypothetical protein